MKLIGAGGFGRVYMRRDGVVMKVSPISHKKIALHEARILRLLSHAPSVPRLHGLTVSSKEICIMMSYGGECLSRNLDDSIDVMRQIGSALQHLHDLHLVHRDIKPQNILADRQRKLYTLCDFGLATCSESEYDVQAVGSPHWRPPNSLPTKLRDVYQLLTVGRWLGGFSEKAWDVCFADLSETRTRQDKTARLCQKYATWMLASTEVEKGLGRWGPSLPLRCRSRVP